LPLKPNDVVDRDPEWGLLTDFVADPSPAMRLGIVSGRRRHGKSFLLQSLKEAMGGLYVTAAALVLFSLHGFHDDIQRAAAARSDLFLVDLPALYGTGPVLGGR